MTDGLNLIRMSEEQCAPLVAQAQALAAAIRTMDPASARSFFKSVTVNNPDAVAVAIDVEDLLRQIRRDRAED